MIRLLQALAALATHRRDQDRGASAVEYGLLVALIALTMAIGVGIFSGMLADLLEGAADLLTGAAED